MDSALVRLLNIGIYLAFKGMLHEALNEVLEKRLPYLMFSVDDFSKNFGDPKFEMVIRSSFRVVSWSRFEQSDVSFSSSMT